jgi:predicted DNA-binding antitoxin AbrB/MazE fold protein
MALIVEAVYENGVLRPTEPLGLREHEKVRITVQQTAAPASSAPIIRCEDQTLIEWAAMDAELEYPPPPEPQ